MKKHFRKLKTTLIIGLLLITVFTALIPTSSAGIIGSLLGLKTNVIMNYDAIGANEKVVPLSGEITINLSFETQIEGILARFVANILSQNSVQVSVDLTVEDAPSWATARVSPNVVTAPISSSWVETAQESYIHVSFKDDAPAHEVAIFTIKMHASVPGGIFNIRDYTTTATVSFTPSYLPIIDATPKETYKEITPGEIAVFDIELENLGNAETEYLFKVVPPIPDGWSASIVSSTKVGSELQGDNPRKTVQLFVQPPFNFGYHNDRKDITITVMGRYYAGGVGVLETDEYELIFTVQNRGFSTPGFEVAGVLAALVVIILIQRKRKTK